MGKHCLELRNVLLGLIGLGLLFNERHEIVWGERTGM
jgi:hypothetical protein